MTRDTWQVFDFGATLEKVRPFTMVPTEALVDLARQVQAVLTCGIPGDFVECGVWRGGAAFLMADLLQQAGVRDRKVWLFDSFEGLPPPEEIDGPAATEYVENTDGPWYFDNCRVSLEEVQRTARGLGLASYTELVKGWFNQTLPAYRQRIGPIAILRIDCDWYASVRCCLDNLFDQVVDGGFVIFDDYYTFEGCAIAVHEFLGERRLSHRLESVVGRSKGYTCYVSAVLRKGNASWYDLRQWLDRRDLALQDIAALIPTEDAFILTDQETLRGELGAARQAIPFLERDGHYWGPPADDDTAICELGRLRRSGASFIVFAWPAFWWLDHYTDFVQHLRSNFPCVVENDRLVVFDLR